MPARLAWLVLFIMVAAGATAHAGDQPPSPALVLWLRGQEAMRDGNIEQAIALYHQSLQLAPELACNHLSLAAGYVALNQNNKAVFHLGRYLEAQPEHFTVRGHLAELLLRLGRPEEARAQFERFIADIQDNQDLAGKHLVHCHSRLMEIAQAADDEYAEHLHRGIGLYLIAVQRTTLREAGSGVSEEGLLCQAAGELTLARQRRPGEARPCWYLHEVWSRLAQAQPAARCLHAAETAAPFTHLTPHELARLQLACRRQDCEGSAK